MLRDLIKKDLEKALKNLKLSGVETKVSRTSDSKNGDYSSNVALRLATSNKRQAIRDKPHSAEASNDRHEVKQSPMEVAKKITDSIGSQPYIERLEVKEPGFINFFIKSEFWQDQVKDVLKAGSKYGSNEDGSGKGARVEFVSANPTGPLHFGNARGGPIGDSLASVLEFCGYKVVREYYHNDIGVQVEKLGESILNVSEGKKLDDQEYKGEYVHELATKLGKEKLSAKELGKKAVDILLADAIDDCKLMGVRFDEVYSESELIESEQTKEALGIIDKKGFLKKKDGASWFAPSDEFLKDRETVVVKGDGSYTYFANDIAYHNLKFKDDPALVIDVFGSNHHGHVPRLQAVIKALGYNVSRFHVILYQWVRFKRGDEVVKMSKRSGTFITAREVLEEIGRDAVRFFILMHDANSPIDFDLDLAREKSSKNPVFYAQYANARICSILAKVKVKDQKSEVNFGLLTTKYELDLIKQITKLPDLVEDISNNFAVHYLTSYAVDLADSFHKFYENCRVVGEKKELEEARISLLLATKIALQNTLGLLGVSAPEKM